MGLYGFEVKGWTRCVPWRALEPEEIDLCATPDGAPSDPLRTLRTERAKVYGDARESHANIGKAWGAALERAGYIVGQPVPEHLVAAMMVMLKVLRGITSGGEHRQDSYDDAKVYVDFVSEFHPARPRG